MARQLEARSLVEVLRDALEQEILRGEIEPGAQLTEQWVAARFNIARPTAKAAIEQLVGVGILRRTLNKAARVPTLGAEDVRDLYLSRAILERGIVKLLAKRQATVPAAERAIVQLRASGDDVADVVEADMAFHRALARAVDSPRVTRLHDVVIGETHLCMAQVQVHRLLSPSVIADEHAGILAAIERGEVAETCHLLDAHLERAETQLLDYLTAQPQVVVS